MILKGLNKFNLESLITLDLGGWLSWNSVNFISTLSRNFLGEFLRFQSFIRYTGDLSFWTFKKSASKLWYVRTVINSKHNIIVKMSQWFTTCVKIHNSSLAPEPEISWGKNQFMPENWSNPPPLFDLLLVEKPGRSTPVLYCYSSTAWSVRTICDYNSNFSISNHP